MYEPEDQFERELREGLRPREAPEGLAERIIALAGAPAAYGRKQVQSVRAPGMFSERPALRWAIAAMLLIAMGLGGYAERQRQMAGERAREQVFLALRITSSTLQAVHHRVADGNRDGEP